jgi:cysteinyl-tRNA synthetase
MSKVFIYDSYSREKREFVPIAADFVTMYVCGPTVYSDVHLGNCRTFISFDIIYRYFLAKGFRVRYVRNITDVGHLVGDVDCDAESKVEKRARLEQKEPMEIVQKYTNGFHAVMQQLGTLPPSIEPTATGHLIEQIEMVREILRNGYAYEVNGSVYFDTQKLIETKPNIYGKLSGKQQDELLEESRDNLKNQSEKRHPSDFALWVKASPMHLMRWNTEWSEGYPGWHLECSAMSTKYLGKTFDIHGGGMDLQFPHHENEIAQNLGACDCLPANYWMHANMMLLNGKKMSKSDGNNITPAELFQTGSPFTSKVYSPMVFRFLLLQTHYRSTLNLTDDGLLAAEQGYTRIMKAFESLQKLSSNRQEAGAEDAEILAILQSTEEAMADDFNTAMALSHLFGLVNKINAFANNQLNINELSVDALSQMKAAMQLFLFDIFGLKDETNRQNDNSQLIEQLMQLTIDLRQDVRARKDFATSDLIRDRLLAAGIQLKDSKTGVNWEHKKD